VILMYNMSQDLIREWSRLLIAAARIWPTCTPV
jgi:hypothetical protein